MQQRVVGKKISENILANCITAELGYNETKKQIFLVISEFTITKLTMSYKNIIK